MDYGFHDPLPLGERVFHAPWLGGKVMDTNKITPDDDKFKELVLYIARQSEGNPRFGATKLNKLLFFSDFLAYKLFGQPITGQDYFRLDHGPAPRRLMPLKSEMIAAGDCIEVDRNYFGRLQKVVVASREPDLAAFSGQEIALVDQLIKECAHLNATEISGESHGFVGWQIADDQEDIPYKLALVNFGKVTERDKKHATEIKDELFKLNQECANQVS